MSETLHLRLRAPYFYPKQIVFALNSTTGVDVAGIYVMDADGSNVRRLAHFAFVYVECPDWSPDDR